MTTIAYDDGTPVGDEWQDPRRWALSQLLLGDRVRFIESYQMPTGPHTDAITVRAGTIGEVLQVSDNYVWVHCARELEATQEGVRRVRGHLGAVMAPADKLVVLISPTDHRRSN